MDREKLRDIFRKYRAVGLVLLAGLLLLLLPTGKSSGQERQTSDDTQLYSLEETEQRMAQLLGRMSGVGRSIRADRPCGHLPDPPGPAVRRRGQRPVP